MIGEALSIHPLVRKVGFTGSTSVGKTIMQRFVELSSLPDIFCVSGSFSTFSVRIFCDFLQSIPNQQG